MVERKESKVGDRVGICRGSQQIKMKKLFYNKLDAL